MQTRNTIKRRRGFTLLELLVVMFILMLLAGVVTAVVVKRMEEARHAKAVADVEVLSSAIDTYHIQNGAYPQTLEDLRTKPSGEDLPNWNGPYIKKPVPDDPWEQPYAYTVPGEHGDYDLYTYGKDGREGGSGSDADVTSWQN